jgi:hypothetical protein
MEHPEGAKGDPPVKQCLKRDPLGTQAGTSRLATVVIPRLARMRIEASAGMTPHAPLFR